MIKRGICAIGIALAMSSWCGAENPIIQTIYTADPAPMVHDGTLYLYTSHDEDGSTWFTMHDWRCFSTKDMVNWTHHGSPLGYKSFSWSRGDAWAGQVIERNGKFYYYIPCNKKGGGMVIGVAVSDTPTGPFKDVLGHPLVEDGEGDIDPSVFIDDDGQAYLYWGNPHLKYVKLNADMVSYDKTLGVVRVPLTAESFGKREKDPKRATLYEEGPWIYKRNGMYYLVYAASGIPENIAYATAPTATGPWTYRGIIMPTEGKSFTNHPGVIDYKGKSYFFYHNGALPGGGGFTRSVCVEEFVYNPDGTFPTIKMSKEGVKPVGTLNPYERVEAETMAWGQGVETATNESSGVYVTDISNGDYIKVRNVDFATGAKKFTGSVAATAGGKIELRVGGIDGKLVGTLEVKPTGAADKWETQSTSVEGLEGIADLYLKFIGGEGVLMNVDWWRFEK